MVLLADAEIVSTRSRPKAAGVCSMRTSVGRSVSTHSRPKAAGKITTTATQVKTVSTHSRPKAAGKVAIYWAFCINRFNSQPPEGGWIFGVSLRAT